MKEQTSMTPEVTRICDFHTHTCLSDGTLTPIELIRRAFVHGYRAIAVTDHVGLGSMRRVLEETIEDCRIAREYWDIIAIPGIELTHLPPQTIGEAAKEAKQLGAWLVVVHGETIVEPVENGTNMEAVQSADVDILAHPGILTPEEAKAASTSGVFIEISARQGHSLTNGHLAKVTKQAKNLLLLNSDAHDSNDLLTTRLAVDILRGSGIEQSVIQSILTGNAEALLRRLSSR
ncbi:MAG: histidinol phosphate phosphatase domain-containing protein [Chloroflexota bacterium]|nr:histidinol phosphate phosphatase domain-containing protein [Chloroflexota bacterium]